MSKLEISEGIQLAHPFNKGYDQETVCANEDDALRVARGGDAPAATGDAASGEAEEKITVYTTSFYVGLVMDTSRC